MAYGISIGPIGWVLPSEVFPLSVRSKGVAISTASVWLNNCAFLLLCRIGMQQTDGGRCSPHRPHHARAHGYFTCVRCHLPAQPSSAHFISTSRSTFALFATASFAAYMWATYRVPETSGVALEEIGAMFSHGGNLELEEAALRQQIEGDMGLPNVVRRAAAGLSES